MQSKPLGSSGLQVSVVGLGCNNFGMKCDQAATNSVVHRALDLGVTLFDTADIYGNRGESERMLGKALGTRRREIVLATKFGMQMDDSGTAKGASKRYIAQAVEASLQRLNTDYIDLYQLHQPAPETPIEETLEALHSLIQAGKVRHIGCSNFSGQQLTDSWNVARQRGLPPFTSVQNEYSLIVRSAETELFPAAKACGAGLLPYFPLANGLLTGKYKRGQPAPEGSRLAQARRSKHLLTDANFELVEKLSAFAEARGHTILELAIGWLASHLLVSSVIAGATTPEQVEQNVAAGRWQLSPAELAEVNGISARRS